MDARSQRSLRTGTMRYHARTPAHASCQAAGLRHGLHLQQSLQVSAGQVLPMALVGRDALL